MCDVPGVIVRTSITGGSFRFSRLPLVATFPFPLAFLGRVAVVDRALVFFRTLVTMTAGPTLTLGAPVRRFPVILLNKNTILGRNSST